MGRTYDEWIEVRFPSVGYLSESYDWIKEGPEGIVSREEELGLPEPLFTRWVNPFSES